mmetsp:Transcript_14233/g.43170  ORF Transcript_14233/g.43170 Transcript_14233/m.43170 type:complete len:219 (-) Transcript_14233:755-1411(-)
MAVVASKVVVLIWAVLALTGRALAVNIESTDVFQDCLNDTATCVNIALPSKELTGSIPTDIATFTALTVLNLGQNSLAGTIPTNLPTSLQELRLGFNEIGGTLPLELGLLTSLTMLDLSYNHIKGAMPPHVGNMTSLRYFLVPFNSLTGSIPTTIGSLSQLRALCVQCKTWPVWSLHVWSAHFMVMCSHASPGLLPRHPLPPSRCPTRPNPTSARAAW